MDLAFMKRWVLSIRVLLLSLAVVLNVSCKEKMQELHWQSAANANENYSSNLNMELKRGVIPANRLIEIYRRIHPPLTENDQLTQVYREVRKTVLWLLEIGECEIDFSSGHIVNSRHPCLAKINSYYGVIENGQPMGYGIKRISTSTDCNRDNSACGSETYYLGDFISNSFNGLGKIIIFRRNTPSITSAPIMVLNDAALAHNGSYISSSEWDYKEICNYATSQRTMNSAVWSNSDSAMPFIKAAMYKKWNCFITKLEVAEERQKIELERQRIELERQKAKAAEARKRKIAEAAEAKERREKRYAAEAEQRRKRDREKQRLATAKKAEEKRQRAVENERLKQCIKEKSGSLVGHLPFSERKRFIKQCLSDGKGFVDACNCTYFMLKCKGQQPTIDNIIRHGQVGNLSEGFGFMAEYLACGIGGFLK
jgi:hypothetical protein